MVSVKEIKELIKSETQPLKKQISGILSSKYDQLLNQNKTSNEKHKKYDAHFKEQLESVKEELKDLAPSIFAEIC